MVDIEASAAVEEYSGQASLAKIVEIARYFLFIGVVGFGGPLVHIALMEDDLVGEDSRGWTDESIFMEGLAICNMLPGPASTQLGIFMGWIRPEIRGLSSPASSSCSRRSSSWSSSRGCTSPTRRSRPSKRRSTGQSRRHRAHRRRRVLDGSERPHRWTTARRV